MKAGEMVELDDGTLCRVVDRLQRDQLHGWWLMRESTGFDGAYPFWPRGLKDMWGADERDEDLFSQGYLCLCPVGQLDETEEETFARWMDLGEQTRVVANPKQSAGDKKLPLQWVPPALQAAAARALGEGGRKYGPYNWRDLPVEAMTYVGAIQRHLLAWMDGEELDPDSEEGKHHLDGVAGSLAVLLDSLHGGYLIDNRPKKGPGISGFSSGRDLK